MKLKKLSGPQRMAEEAAAQRKQQIQRPAGGVSVVGGVGGNVAARSHAILCGVRRPDLVVILANTLGKRRTALCTSHATRAFVGASAPRGAECQSVFVVDCELLIWMGRVGGRVGGRGQPGQTRDGCL